jgi:hypothetical protein
MKPQHKRPENDDRHTRPLHDGLSRRHLFSWVSDPAGDYLGRIHGSLTLNECVHQFLGNVFVHACVTTIRMTPNQPMQRTVQQRRFARLLNGR